jgi:hypothetical protein
MTNACAQFGNVIGPLFYVAAGFCFAMAVGLLGMLRRRR